ncbi:CapA family protein [Microbaculum marinisediminis]|uniref:CapA family protein n=1 Tax=Microbaculum marinisediminis TaxID=2931392 RepID=A0AAW5R0I5_9HYPH|nr:CapA family protein [Microbaculum sp. A6E488]MCT8973697.1 CapA family protein [Microbaculum sp. A6E488]
MAAPIRTLAFLGDVMLGRLVSDEIGRRPPAFFWGDALSLLHGADAVFVNLECAVTGNPEPWRRTEKVFHFKAVPKAIDVLKAARVRFACLANNHVLDFETEGLLETLSLLDSAGIPHAGAGRTRDEAERAAFVDVKGLRVALFAATDNEPDFAATDEAPGTKHVDPYRDEPVWPTPRDIEAARSDGADLVVASLHLGPNMVLQPSPPLRGYKQRLCESGVDIVHGHSAHVFQGVERRGNGLILHDTGDYLDDYAVDPQLRNDWSFVFVVEADETGLKRLVLHPVRLEFATTRRADGPEAAAICDRMEALSEPFGTRFRRVDGRLELDLAD